MKKTLLLLAVLFLLSGKAVAQSTFKGTFVSREEKLNLVLDLYQESVEVPGMEMFGPMHGYLNGNVYGVWSVTSAAVKDARTAVLRLSNDLGSETQEVRLTQTSDSTYLFEQVDGVVIKKVVKKKLVKIPSKIIFLKK